MLQGIFEILRISWKILSFFDLLFFPPKNVIWMSIRGRDILF